MLLAPSCINDSLSLDYKPSTNGSGTKIYCYCSSRKCPGTLASIWKSLAGDGGREERRSGGWLNAGTPRFGIASMGIRGRQHGGGNTQALAYEIQAKVIWGSAGQGGFSQALGIIGECKNQKYENRIFFFFFFTVLPFLYFICFCFFAFF